jgi:lysophospholipase L1-like esterase
VQEVVSADDDAVVAAGAPDSTTAATTTMATTVVPSVVPHTIAVEGLAGGTTVAPGATNAPNAPSAPATTLNPVTTTAPSRPPAAGDGVALDPTWPKELFVLSDSVVLSGKAAIPARFPDWRVEIDGKPALMLKAANERLQARGKPVGSVAVMAIGYNSLWEKNRRNYDRWAEQFDKEADRLLETLASLGAKKVVWVTLREPTPETVPAKAVKELSQYSWYFPYVNERLHALAERHPEVALADWTAVSNQNGITYDSIHLNDTGAKLMADTIAQAVGLPPA